MDNKELVQAIRELTIAIRECGCGDKNFADIARDYGQKRTPNFIANKYKESYVVEYAKSLGLNASTTGIELTTAKRIAKHLNI